MLKEMRLRKKELQSLICVCYPLKNSDGTWGYKFELPYWVKLEKDEYITIGNTSVIGKLTGFIGNIIEMTDDYIHGIYYNREIKATIDSYNDGDGELYTNNAAYKREITEEQLNDVIEVHEELNDYGLISNNCCKVAIKAWNKAFSDDILKVYVKPSKLKGAIEEKNGFFRLSLIDLYGIK